MKPKMTFYAFGLFLTLPFILGGHRVSAYASPLAFPQGEGPDGTKYKTAYSCEEEILDIKCDEEESIQVIRANYGRFSIAICNNNGYTDWSVNCMSPKTKRVLKNKCDGKQACQMPVNSRIFGDPCPGTHKYVEVHFACSPQHLSTTKQPLPPWYLEGNAGQLWHPHRETSQGTKTTPKPTTRSSQTTPKRKPILVTRPTTIQTTETIKTTTTSTTPLSVTSARIPITTPRPSTKTSEVPNTKKNRNVLPRISPSLANNGNQNSNNVKDEERRQQSDNVDNYPEVEVIVSDIPSSISDAVGFCRPTISRNIHWNWTREGELAIVPCPFGATGLARWSCSSSSLPPFMSEWTSPNPDLSDCKSNSMSHLEVKVRQEDPENVIVSSLSKVTSVHNLYGGDLETATTVMTTVANRIQYLLQTQSDSFYRKDAYIQEVFQNIVRSASNLLSQAQRPAWSDLHLSDQMKTATSLLLALEENAFSLADVLKQEEVIEEASREIAVSVHVVHSADNGVSSENEKSISFPSNRHSSLHVFGPIEDSIKIPYEDVLRNADHAAITRAVFFSYKSLHEILNKSDVNLSQTEVESVEDLILNSRIVSASLAKGRHLQLEKPVEIKLKHLTTENVSHPICVFWDFELSAWSDSGCRVKHTETGFTLCECNHLTNFGLLMRQNKPEDEVEDVILVVLQILSYIAIAVSLFVLLLVCYKFRTKIYKLLNKFGCFGEEKKNGGGALQGCPKSQSFYSGVNLVTLGPNANNNAKMVPQSNQKEENLRSQISSTLGPNSSVLGANKSLTDQDRISQLLLQRQLDATLRVQNNQQQNQLHQSYGQVNHGLYGGSMNSYCVLEQPDGMEATKHLRDSVYMSPQLVNLTNTLRSKKKCQGGHMNDCTMLPENEVVFRAVSPHGHVYWEIDPRASNNIQGSVVTISDEDERAQNGASTATSSSEMSSSRQSSSRYSDNHPLITESPQHFQQQQQQQHVLVNPFADVQLLSSVSASSSPTSALAARKNSDFRFSSLRLGPKKANLANHFATRKGGQIGNDDIIPEQVQIRDIRSIPVSVKSNDYILAKIQSHMNRGSPVDLVATTTALNGKIKQRKV